MYTLTSFNSINEFSIDNIFKVIRRVPPFTSFKASNENIAEW